MRIISNYNNFKFKMNSLSSYYILSNNQAEKLEKLHHEKTKSAKRIFFYSTERNPQSKPKVECYLPLKLSKP